jgi:hypothetical protein
LMMEAVRSSETTVYSSNTIRHYIPEKLSSFYSPIWEPELSLRSLHSQYNLFYKIKGLLQPYKTNGNIIILCAGNLSSVLCKIFVIVNS